MYSARAQSYVRLNLSLLALLGAAFVLALGCGGSSPAGGAGAAGTSGGGSPGTAGTSATGSGGSGSGGMSTGTGGATGAAGTTGAAGATGAAGTTGTTGTAGATGAGGSGTDGGYDGPSVGVDGGGKIPVGMTQCSDGIDNDNDGRIDYLDGECVGPLDNDESSYATGIPGDNSDACKQDCFFDGNSGMGDDHCLWQLKCDPKSTSAACPYDQGYATSHATECSIAASQSQDCVNFCRRLVPNGCDCFGCCAIPGGPTVRLAATCTAADFNDPVKCPPCTQVTQCANPCGECEICVGKPTLPASCNPVTGTDAGTGTDSGTPPPPRCDSDFRTECGPGTAVPADGCPAPLGCITGCCVPIE